MLAHGIVQNTHTQTYTKHSRIRNINSTINLRVEFWTLRRTSSISRKSGKTHTDTQSCSLHAHLTPLCILFPLSSLLPLHLYPCLLSSLPVSLPLLLTFTTPLWSIPLSSSPPASWMLKQEIKGWRSTLSGNQRCLGAFQPCAAGQASAQQRRAGERAAQNNAAWHGKVPNDTSTNNDPVRNKMKQLKWFSHTIFFS